MIVGGYELHLYCDTGGDPYGGKCPYRDPLTSPQGETFGSSLKECMGLARARGWTFKTRGRVAFCPRCSGKEGRDDC